MEESNDDPNEAIRNLFVQYEEMGVRFEDIETPLHPSPTICAMLKIASMMLNPSKFNVQAAHDRLFLQGLSELARMPTADDVLYLARCGVIWDSEADRFGMHC